jgi:isopentenyldiphosphate isomerase
MSGRIAVVDADNRFLRWEDRATIHRERLIHRSIHVLLYDSAGRLVLQRRHPGKQTFPDHWDLSASGHVEESDYLGGPDDRLDEVYARVAARELEEELGVVTPLERLGRFAPQPGLHYEWIHLFRGVSDGPYVAQPDEVAEIRAVTDAERLVLGARAPFTPTLLWFTR